MWGKLKGPVPGWTVRRVRLSVYTVRSPQESVRNHSHISCLVEEAFFLAAQTTLVAAVAQCGPGLSPRRRRHHSVYMKVMSYPAGHGREPLTTDKDQTCDGGQGQVSRAAGLRLLAILPPGVPIGVPREIHSCSVSCPGTLWALFQDRVVWVEIDTHRVDVHGLCSSSRTADCHRIEVYDLSMSEHSVNLGIQCK